MTCPHCNVAAGSKVIDTRGVSDSKGERIRRRKVCMSCGERHTTYELIERAPKKKYRSPKVKDGNWLQRILAKVNEIENDWQKIV